MIIDKEFTPILEKNGFFSASIKKEFKPFLDINKYIQETVKWATKQRFKENGRTPQEILKNSITGKLGEFGIYEYFKSLGYDPTYPELLIRNKKGEYDDGDMVVNNRKINIKTAPFFSNLLKLIANDWDENGGYRWGINGIDYSYKAFFLARISPNPHKLIFEYPFIDNEIIEYLQQVYFQMDIPGFINIKDFKKIISNGHMIKNIQKNLDGKEIDLSFYYCQCGELRDLSEILPKK